MPTPRFDVTAIGEVMLRYSVPVGERLERAQHLAIHPGGAEANMLGGLSCLGRRCAWVSGLPNNPLGRIITNHLHLAKVNTEAAQSLATRFHIRSIPTLAIFKGGQEIARQSGAMSEQDLVRWAQTISNSQ